jgi:hypothetical protein
MQKYPEIGEQVRVKGETGLRTVRQLWKPGRVELDDLRIFYLDGIITRHQKYITVYVIQVHYGGRYGWEDVTEEETRSEAIQRRKEYRENVQYPVRLIRRKEPNSLYQK